MARRIDLKLALTLCIVGLSALSFAAASIFVLIEADAKSQARNRDAADLVARNLAIQLAQSAWARTSPQPFPELERSSALLHIPGLCIGFKPLDGTVVQRICGGTASDDHKVPVSFAWLYRQIFHPGREATQAVMDGGRIAGYALVLVDPASEIGEAWRETSHLLGVIGVTLVGMCFLVFGGLTLVLRPTRTVLRGLERLAEGDLSARLPEFGINELSHVATGFNRLAENLDANIRERIELTKRLIATQEDER
jgi:methyl-accepting chemotaxis protein